MKPDIEYTGPRLWGWNDESIYFVLNGSDDTKPFRIQDYPELMAMLVMQCESYFIGKEST